MNRYQFVVVDDSGFNGHNGHDGVLILKQLGI